MPKVTYKSMVKQPHPLVELIWGRAAALDINNGQLAKIFGVTTETLRTRRNNPDSFTFGEIKKVCRSLGIKSDEVRAAIRL